MLCPKCQGDTEVLDTRLRGDNSIRRRRQCTSATCGERFTTTECIVTRDDTSEQSAHELLVNSLKYMIKLLERNGTNGDHVSRGDKS
jgi:transcriptional regulator NrdR family protein